MIVGRKRRQNIKRQPNGQPSRERGIDPKAIAQLMPHRRLVPADVAHDPKAESELGRLCLNGWITEAQYQAGVKYRDIVQRYRIVIDCPRSTEASMNGVIVGPWAGGGELCKCRNWHEKCEKAPGGRCALDRMEKYNAAFEHLEANAGNRGARAVAHCVMQDKKIPHVAHLKCGLTALAEHFGLTFVRKASTAINRS